VLRVGRRYEGLAATESYRETSGRGGGGGSLQEIGWDCTDEGRLFAAGFKRTRFPAAVGISARCLQDEDPFVLRGEFSEDSIRASSFQCRGNHH